jgi:hypothetical protein
VYRRPKFLEILLKIREEMAREADYDVDLFAEMVRFGKRPEKPRPETTPKIRQTKRRVAD